MTRFSLLLFACFLTIGLRAQDEEKKLIFGFYTGLSDYYGELNTQFFNIDKAVRVQFGGSLFYNINPSFNAGLDVSYGSHGFHLPSSDKYRAQIIKSSAQLQFKLNNGIILPEDFIIRPFIFVGGGIANTFEDLESTNIPGLDLTFNSGFGLQYPIHPLFSLQYQTNWAITNNDIRDKQVVGKFNDMFMIHSIGVVVPIGKVIDNDEDGVRDNYDRCPNTPVGVAVDGLGCPYDKDLDGVADYQDVCYDEFGLPSALGCPDKDDDGIADVEDKCPEIAGPKETMGCPDRDKDGLFDNEDLCPEIKGPKETKGCPDSDGDGINDNDDACPQDKGTKALMGCPDSDNDGIIDTKDQCPKIPGVVSNNGCPEIEESTKKTFEQALKGIQFETGKSIIKPISFTILNEVVAIMLDNPSYKLSIFGHTDNQGDANKNLILSKERAKSVKAYLMERGVNESRLTAEGFGATLPKVSNDTAEGRAINRRVEFNVTFE